MASQQSDPAAVRQLMKLAGVSPGGQATDRELLERFVQDRSEAAFADLMARHGSMVLAVCRRHLRDHHAADDAFQATFLVLARKAGSVRWRESIAGWLFEVATRVAKKVAGQAARRSAREGAPADAIAEPTAPTPSASSADLLALQAALDHELQKLPEKLRTPVVLCHLEGLSQDEVARHLGVTDGQLRGRLYRAKERLRERLVRRGFTLTAVLLAFTVGATAHAVSAVLATATLRLISAAPNTIPNAVHLLTQGVIRDMTTTFKTTAILAVLAVLGLAATGYAIRTAIADPQQPPSGIVANQPQPRQKPPGLQPDKPNDPKPPEPVIVLDKGWLRTVDAVKNQLFMEFDTSVGENEVDDYTPQTKVFFGDKPATLADLKPGMRVHLVYHKGSDVLQEVRAFWPRVVWDIKAVDAAKRTVTFETQTVDGITLDATLPLAEDAAITLDGEPARPGDIPLGKGSWLNLSSDKKSLIGVSAYTSAYDISGEGWYNAKTAMMAVHTGPDAELVLPVAADAKVTWNGEPAKISDVKTDLRNRMRVLVRLSADRKTIIGVVAITGDLLSLPKPKRK